jgi:hypothetical protein
MSEALTIAILQAVAKMGFTGVITFLENRGSTVDDAISALRLAQSKTLEEMIAEDAAKRLKAALPSKPEGAD